MRSGVLSPKIICENLRINLRYLREKRQKAEKQATEY